MKALIFAAGLGTRLKPFTLQHPKALVPVGGIPMLQHVILRLKTAGVTEIVVNVHHFAEQIVNFINGHNFGLKITVSDESDRLLDTGGGLLHARRLLDDGSGAPIIIHNSDILTDSDLADMLQQHINTSAVATLLVRRRPSSRHLYFNAERQLLGWSDDRNSSVRPEGFIPDDTMEKCSFGGVHIVSPQIFDSLQKYADKNGPVFSITPFYTDCCTQLPIYGFEQQTGYIWADIGDAEKLARANILINNLSQ